VRLGPSALCVIFPQPSQIRALLVRPAIYGADHRFTQRSPQPPVSLRFLGEGINHLLVAIQPP
jgi:hypothetical protein